MTPRSATIATGAAQAPTVTVSLPVQREAADFADFTGRLEAAATVDAAWDEGTRYFDTAPFYGAGLSEIRLGKKLSGHKRGDYILSTKVGRLVLDEVEDASARDLGEKGDIFKYGRPNKVVYDYSETGTMKSIEDSPKRLGASRSPWPAGGL